MGGAVAFIAPIATIYLTPVDNSRIIYNLRTKNEKHRNAYRTAYEKETRKQRLKSVLSATSSCTISLGVLVAVSYVFFPYMISYH